MNNIAPIASTMGGGNDIYSNQDCSFVNRLYGLIQILHFTIIIVHTTQINYDLPTWSCVNDKIRKKQGKLKIL